MPFKRLVWHDPNIGNPENSFYMKRFQKDGWIVNTTTSVAETVEKLNRSTFVGPVVVLTSGTNGEELVKKTHTNCKVVGYIVFCMNKEYHQTWADQYDKVKRVCTIYKETEIICVELNNVWLTLDVIETVEGLPNTTPVVELVAQQYGINDFVSNKHERANYCPVCNALAITFVQILTLSRSAKFSSDEVLAVLQKVVPANKWDKFNELWTAQKWKRPADIDDLQPSSLGQKICLGYTSNYFYRQLNQRLAESRFGEVTPLVVAFAQDLSRQESTLSYSGHTLWRGVQRQYVKLEDYSPGSRKYWPNFISASKSKYVAAEGFAKSHGVLFKLHRRTQMPMHPHVDIERKPDWGHFGKSEGEVLLMPFLHVQVIKHTTEGGRIIIHVQELPSPYQSDPYPIINKWVHKELKPKIMNLFVDGQESVFENIKSDISLYTYFERFFRADYDVHFNIYAAKHSPNPNTGDNFKNFFTAGGVVRSYVKSLVDFMKLKIPQSIQKRLNKVLTEGVKKNMGRITRLVRTEMELTFPDIPLGALLENLRKGLEFNLNIKVGDGLIIVELFVFLISRWQDLENMWTFSESSMKEQARNQAWAKLKRVVNSKPFGKQLAVAEKENMELFVEVLKKQGEAATDAAQKTILKTFTKQ